MITVEKAKEILKEAGQEQILKYFEELSDAQKEELLIQIEETDFEVIKKSLPPKPEVRGEITPIEVMTSAKIALKEEEYKAKGMEAIQAGKVAALLLAGGMGTRLGSDDPKGMYNVGLTRELYIFECLINNIKDVSDDITLFIMTSDKNDAKTQAFFKEKNYFGYKPENVFFFKQAMAAATDFEGKVYLEEKGHIATSPNGNGGFYASLCKAGLRTVLEERGIEWLNIFAVDNVLQRICDPKFIGAVLTEGYSSGAKVIKKVEPFEKVGAMCLEDGHPSIVEYYDLTDEMAHAKGEDGEYLYYYGVILNYLFSVKELDRIKSAALPLHVVDKKIPYLDENGNLVSPTEPNGHKFENLILDMVRMMTDCLPYEVVRNYEFAPIKNKTGVDSVESARALLKENGVVL